MQEPRSSILDMLSKPPVREMISNWPGKGRPSGNRRTAGVTSASRTRGLR